MKSSVLVLQMDKFRHISTELWPLIEVLNWFFTLYLWHFFTDFLQTWLEKVYFFFKMIFFALKISSGGVCCMPAALLFGNDFVHFQNICCGYSKEPSQ